MIKFWNGINKRQKINLALWWILIQFELYDLSFLCGRKYLSCNFYALFDRVIEATFTVAFIIIIFCTLYLFIILVIWWVRWIRRRRKWQTWVWIWVIWYVWYIVGWVVAWCKINFRYHGLCWWVMWWWCTVTCSISKYSWIGYQRVQMKLMYWRRCMLCMYLQ